MTTESEKPETFNAKRWISRGDASRARGVSRQAIWELVKRGRITTTVFKGRVYLDRAEVMAFKRRPRGAVVKKSAKLKKKNFDPSKWYSLIEAARATGVTRQVIADLVRRRRFRTLVSAGKMFVLRSAVENFKPLPKPKIAVTKKK